MSIIHCYNCGDTLETDDPLPERFGWEAIVVNPETHETGWLCRKCFLKEVAERQP